MTFDAGSLFLSVVVSSVGFVLFRYGRVRDRMPHVIAGVVLMAYPYFVGGVLWMSVIAAAVIGLLWAAVRAGL